MSIEAMERNDFSRAWRGGRRADLDLRLLFDPEPMDKDFALMAQCIYHDDSSPSMAIYWDHIFCYGCRTNRWADEFLARLGGEELSTERRAAGSKAWIPEYLPMSMADTFHSWLMGPYAARLDWLYARGLRQDTIIANKLGHCTDAFTIPVFDADYEKLLTVRYRRDDLLASPDERRKYWGTAGHNDVVLYSPIPRGTRELWQLNLGDLVFEGEFDALLASQDGFDAHSFTNGAGQLEKPETWEPLWNSPRLTLVTDMDDAGAKAARAAREILGDRARAVRWAPSLGKDYTEFRRRYPVESFVELVRRTWR